MPVRHQIDIACHIDAVFHDICALLTTVVQKIPIGDRKVPLVNMKFRNIKSGALHHIFHNRNLIPHVTAVNGFSAVTFSIFINRNILIRTERKEIRLYLPLFPFQKYVLTPERFKS